ncbi:lysosome-associated membrane glycoprotein (Lamp) domain-containing protein [Phthorimaea operculella]|nr:lysosome-associated membrane glycoprotein (Lamp) domain-containing protein [Phthorimaea operculella]
MSRLGFYLLCGALCSLVVLGQGDVPTTPEVVTITGTWSFEQNNKTCIVVQFAAQLNVTYTKDVDNSTALEHVIMNVPANASVFDGSCSANNNTQQWLSMTWHAASLPSNNLTLVFLKNGTNYNLQFLNVTLAAEYFPNICK